jgi:hypothetical protein
MLDQYLTCPRFWAPCPTLPFPWISYGVIVCFFPSQMIIGNKLNIPTKKEEANHFTIVFKSEGTEWPLVKHLARLHP